MYNIYLYGTSQRIDSIHNMILSILSICVLKMPCFRGSFRRWIGQSARPLLPPGAQCSEHGETLAFEDCQSLTPLSCHADNPAFFEKTQDMKFVPYNIQSALLHSGPSKYVVCHRGTPKII